MRKNEKECERMRKNEKEWQRMRKNEKLEYMRRNGFEIFIINDLRLVDKTNSIEMTKNYTFCLILSNLMHSMDFVLEKYEHLLSSSS